MKKKPLTHGGKRTGAGRPKGSCSPSPPLVTGSVRLSVHHWEFLASQGNASRTLRKLIDAAYPQGLIPTSETPRFPSTRAAMLEELREAYSIMIDTINKSLVPDARILAWMHRNVNLRASQAPQRGTLSHS